METTIILLIPIGIILLIATLTVLSKPEKQIPYILPELCSPTFTDKELEELVTLLSPKGYIVIIEKYATRATIHPPMTEERQKENRKRLLQLSEILKK